MLRINAHPGQCSTLRAICQLLAFCLVAQPALADEPSKPLWELAIGGFGMHSPAYPGADVSTTNFIALPFPIYRGSFLRLGEEIEKPVRGQILQEERLGITLDMDFSFGSDAAETPLRTGMPDLDPIVELGPEIEWRLNRNSDERGDWFAALQLRGAAVFPDLTPEWRGWVASPEIRYVRHFGIEGQRLKLRLTPSFASRQYMGYYYDVAPRFATVQRPAYEARGGYLGTTLGLSWHRPVTSDLELRIGARLSQRGGAKNSESPLFAERFGTTIYVAFLYSFWQSDRQVADKN